MKAVIVTGGRDYDDFAMVNDVLDFLKPDLVIQGGAKGADTLAFQWCQSTATNCHTIEADWESHGKAAGPKRNIEMLEKYPEACVIAFPGGKGTANCIKEAVKRNMIVLEVKK